MAMMTAEEMGGAYEFAERAAQFDTAEARTERRIKSIYGTLRLSNRLDLSMEHVDAVVKSLQEGRKDE